MVARMKMIISHAASHAVRQLMFAARYAATADFFISRRYAAERRFIFDSALKESRACPV